MRENDLKKDAPGRAPVEPAGVEAEEATAQIPTWADPKPSPTPRQRGPASALGVRDWRKSRKR